MVLPQDDPALRLITEANAALRYLPINDLGGTYLRQDTAGTTYLKKTDAAEQFGTVNRAYRKRVLLNLPFTHAGYASAQAVWGDFYPQTFAVDTIADELYVIGNNSGATHQIISVFVWSTGTHKVTFATPSIYVSEGAVILREGSNRYLYLRTLVSGLGKIDITTLPAPLAVVTPVATIPTNQGINFTYRNGVWTVSDTMPPISLYESRGSFKRLDTNFNYIGHLTFPESIAGGSSYKYRSSAIPKMQGIAEGPGYFIESTGGYYPVSTASNPYQFNGVRIISGSGETLNDSIMDPALMVPILQAAGLTVTRIENEGVQLVGGKIVSFNILGTTADGGMLFMEEFSSHPAALDFTSAATVWTMQDVARVQSGVQPRTNDGKMYNQATNEVLDTLTNIIDYMKSVGQSVFSFYSSSVTIPDINGVNIPSGYFVKIYNANNATFFMQLIGPGGLHYRITTNTGVLSQAVIGPAWATIPLDANSTVGYSTPQAAIVENGAFVALQGSIVMTTYTSGAILGTLPLGYRPSSTKRLGVAIDDGANGNSLISITGDGVIKIYGTVAATKKVMMDGLRFALV